MIYPEESVIYLSNNPGQQFKLQWNPVNLATNRPEKFGHINTGFVLFSQNKLTGLFQASDWFFQDSKIHIKTCTPKISMLILLTVYHTFQNFHLSL